MVRNAARGKLAIDDCSGACMIVSDLSGYPIQSFHAVIPPGSSAAVAVGGVEDTPIVRDGVVVAVPTLLVTLTADSPKGQKMKKSAFAFATLMQRSIIAFVIVGVLGQ